MYPHSVTGVGVGRCYHTQCLKLFNHVFLCLTLSIFGHVLLCLLLSRLISWNWQWGKFASWPLCKSICQSHFLFVAHLPCSPHYSCPPKMNLWKVYQKYVCSRISCCTLFCSLQLLFQVKYDSPSSGKQEHRCKHFLLDILICWHSDLHIWTTQTSLTSMTSTPQNSPQFPRLLIRQTQHCQETFKTFKFLEIREKVQEDLEK